MDRKSEVYLDYAATTPVDPRVLEVMLPFFHDRFGNPSSIHRYGQAAEAALEDARERMAEGLNCRSDELVFTACGTESDNLALRGAALAQRRERGTNHILISPVEHHAVSHTAAQLADAYGFEVELLGVDENGMVEPSEVEKRIRPTTALVSIIFANNEIGTINPIQELGQICRGRGVLFHTDAVQAAAHLPVDLSHLPVDLMSLGAHKFYGPKGVGALYVRKGVHLLPSQTGGSQEYGYRAGTQNIPYISGMACAFYLAQSERTQRVNHLVPLRDRVIGRVLEEIPDARLTGHPSKRLPNHASFVFRGIDGNSLLMLLDDAGFACSSGSACKTGSPEPSDVLLAIGLDRSWALGSLRVTLGIDTNMEEIDLFLDTLPNLVKKTRVL
ncbi:MAG: cysteine desulfurase family protein [Anaerolineaceae bacterium]|nr:cysteine desulfurase family protein [Anaerolineaceae bacterium]